MTRHDNDQIRDYFGGCVNDLTPAPARHLAQVLYVPFARDAEISHLCASLLSESELQRAKHFVAEDDRARFTQRRAFRRFCGAIAHGSPATLSQVHFEESKNGRPYLPNLPDTWFSFSACRSGYLGAWSSTHAIGVDLEDQARDLEAVELARRFFTGPEAQAVEDAGKLRRLHTFLQFWSLKEAALKSIGEGLPFGLDTFEFTLAPNLCVVGAPARHGGPEQFDAHMIDGAGGCAALVLRKRNAPRG